MLKFEDRLWSSVTEQASEYALGVVLAATVALKLKWFR
jgi:hypothetical protein